VLKRRVVAVVLVQDGIVVQSVGFRKYMPVGKPGIAVEFLCQWGADEIVLIDISASKRGGGPDMKILEQVAQKCLVPLTVGGGITRLSHVDQLIHGGADKVSLNRVFHEDSKLVSEIGEVYGAQCVVVSIDAIKTANGYRVYDYLEARETSYFVKDYARLAAESGAGEILINSVDRDGSGIGFDTALVSEVCESVNIPVICVGGAGSPLHFLDIFKFTKVHAAAAANFLHYSEHSLTVTKSVLTQAGVPIRHDTDVDYSSAIFDSKGRLLKKSDADLGNLLYERIEKEVI
jgi:cyclase